MTQDDLEAVIPDGLIQGRARAALIKAGIVTIGDLAKTSRAKILRLRSVGIMTLQKCDELLKSYGLPPLR